jgi:dihydrofolate reductase
MRPLSLIFAIARNGAIGLNGGLPWHYPEDRNHFFRTTVGHALVMGRRTYEEVGTPLPDRTNIVVSRTFAAPPGVISAESLSAALELAYAKDPSPFVIGGARLFDEAMPLATRVYVTEIPESPPADTFFRFDSKGFCVIEERTTASGLRFVTYERDSFQNGRGDSRNVG